MRFVATSLLSLATLTLAIPAKAHDLRVEIGIAGMHSIKVTSNERAFDGRPADEVYFGIREPSQPVGVRIPSNDGYYAFHGNEMGHNTRWKGVDDRPQAQPVLWTGTLAEGEERHIFFTVGEQENKEQKEIAKAVDGFFYGLSGYAQNSFQSAATKAGQLSAAFLPTNVSDDVLGVFSAEVKNNGGNLEIVWSAQLTTELFGPDTPGGKNCQIQPNGTRADCKGAGALYGINIYGRVVSPNEK